MPNGEGKEKLKVQERNCLTEDRRTSEAALMWLRETDQLSGGLPIVRVSDVSSIHGYICRNKFVTVIGNIIQILTR